MKEMKQSYVQHQTNIGIYFEKVIYLVLMLAQ